MFKEKLVALPAAGKYGRGKGNDIDGLYKLYQDRLDVLCLCMISYNQEAGVAGAGSGSYQV